MSGAPTRRPDRPRAGQPRPRWVLGLGVGLLILFILAGVAWMNRRVAAREILVGWLDRRGIQADVAIERLELTGFVGRIRIGDPASPDVTVERVEVDYAVGLPWSRGGLGVTPSRIRLVRPVARAVWRGGRLSLGSLDPIVEDFRSRPSRPDSRGPLVLIESGRLRLDTEYGPVSLLADARIDDGRLMRLSARMPEAALKSGTFEARALGGRLDLTTTKDRVAVTADLTADRMTLGEAAGQALVVRGTAALPYPDFQARRGDGRAVVDLALSGRRLTVGEMTAADADLAIEADGAVTGWFETLAFSGTSDVRLSAARIATPTLTAVGARLSTSGSRV